MNCCDVFGYEQPLDLVDPHSSALAARWRTVYQWRGKDDLRRTFAKRFVYRLDYGGKPEYAGDIPGARELGLDAAALVEGADTYLERHPAKRAWRARKDTELEQTRIARTFMGRPRRLTDPNPGRRYRAGINHEHQGATTDINNTWILAIARALPWARYQYGAFDSQTWEVPEDRVADAEAAIRAIVDGSCWDVGGRELRVPVDFKPARRSE
jgi:DNA polymerase I-like protein with 3'-5' exonuclease and polymerase domains